MVQTPQENLELVATHERPRLPRMTPAGDLSEATMRRFGLPLAEIAEPVDGPWAKQLRKIAEHHQLVVVAGMFTPSGDGRVKNTLRAVGPGVDAHYHKIHLFDAFGFRESDTVAPGAEPVMITVGEAKVGLTPATTYGFLASTSGLQSSELRSSVWPRPGVPERARSSSGSC